MLGSSKSEGGGDLGSVTIIVIGIGMIVVALTCFKDVPFIGTVFLMPGENIMKAKMADPVVRYALFLIGGLLTAFGINLKTMPGRPANSRRKPWHQA